MSSYGRMIVLSILLAMPSHPKKLKRHASEKRLFNEPSPKVNNHQFLQTDSIEELANFWNTHDLTDFEDRLEEVTAPVFERETKVTVHLQPKEAQAVKKIAALKGVADTDLVRQWVLEKLQLSQE